MGGIYWGVGGMLVGGNFLGGAGAFGGGGGGAFDGNLTGWGGGAVVTLPKLQVRAHKTEKSVRH